MVIGIFEEIQIGLIVQELQFLLDIFDDYFQFFEKVKIVFSVRPRVI